MNPLEKKLPIVEVFGPTVQGEGVVIGQRTFFIRFGLCDYRCVMCDSMHAVDPKSVQANARWMTQDEICDEILPQLQKTNCDWVTLSGGNPAIHDLSHLLHALDVHGINFSVETQGTFCPDWLQHCDYITFSPKGPGMGEKFEPDKLAACIAKLRNHSGVSIKIVVFDARDLEFASMVAEMFPQFVQTDRFYLSHGNPNPPLIGGDLLDLESVDQKMPATQMEYSDWRGSYIQRYKQMLEALNDYPSLRTARFLPQWHHILWGNEKGR